MFGKLGEIAKAMQAAKEMKGRMGDMQERLARMRIRGSAGGGVVAVEVNGKMDVLGVSVEQVVIDSGDKAMLEQLLTVAFNDALFRSKQAAADSMKEITGGIPGMEEALADFGMGS